MILVIGALAGWLVLLSYGWTQAAGEPRERLRAIRWLVLGGVIAWCMVVAVAVLPFGGEFVIPIIFLAFGAYAESLPASKAQVGRLDLRRNGRIAIVVGLIWLIAVVANLLQKGR
jgi:multisubunit Na+/H+ antiporter MnhB subunit